MVPPLSPEVRIPIPADFPPFASFPRMSDIRYRGSAQAVHPWTHHTALGGVEGVPALEPGGGGSVVGKGLRSVLFRQVAKLGSEELECGLRLGLLLC
jgi:hypothetical protein